MNTDIYNKIKNMNYIQICDFVCLLYNQGYDDGSFNLKYEPYTSLEPIINCIYKRTEDK